jgi:hypothetical protein
MDFPLHPLFGLSFEGREIGLGKRLTLTARARFFSLLPRGCVNDVCKCLQSLSLNPVIPVVK